jgi:hypothetical protein
MRNFSVPTLLRDTLGALRVYTFVVGMGWMAADPLSQHKSDGCRVPHSKHMGFSFLHVLFLGALTCALSVRTL